MEDEKIIALYWQRSEEAIARSEEKYGGRCRALARSILSDIRDSEECVSDTYLAAWNAMPPERPAHLGAYLAGICRRLSISCLRRRCAARRGGGEYALCLEELEGVLCSEDTPERRAELNELARAAERFLAALPETERRIFMCRYYLMMPIARIAGSMGLSESKVKSRLHRSRKKLREQLAKEGLL